MIIAAFAAALAAAASPTDAEKQLAELQHIYAQSCDVRAYAAFDDLCDKLKKQMRDAQRAHRAALRAKPAAGASRPAQTPD